MVVATLAVAMSKVLDFFPAIKHNGNKPSRVLFLCSGDGTVERLPFS